MTETVPWDVVDTFQEPGDEILYLNAAFEDGDPRVIAAAIGDIARARGASEIARQAGVSREALYRGFSDQGNPTLASLLSVLLSLNIGLQAVAL